LPHGSAAVDGQHSDSGFWQLDCCVTNN
jgi:hypothetical protein